ncbi:Serine/threonine-protein kinase [Polyrhizophydium stewartii]|uniref:Serine/threonine-protein kinase n=1 Tax=Polyrhizophydium stewartii TaxID=2732419 RepID=A0ABR4MZI2_9FUNG
MPNNASPRHVHVRTHATRRAAPCAAGTPAASGTAKSPSAGSTPAPESNASSSSAGDVPAGSLPTTLPGPGLLLIKILETRGLVMPNGTAVAPGGSTGKDEQQMPFAIIEMDKMEVLAKAIEGNPNNGVANWQSRANFDISRPCEAVMSIYMPGPNRTDVPLGVCRIRPTFTDQKLEEHWLPLTTMDGKVEPLGEVKVQFVFRLAKNKHLAVEDFELLKVIGKGSFGKVMQVRKKDTGRTYAMKIIKKAHIVERDEVSHTLAERNVLTKLQHPFIVPLKYSFQSAEKLYLVLAFVNGGELFHHLQQEGKFSEDRAKFYTAELLCALECLHSFNIIYRDLKPENILLDYSGHICLCDFGLCKLNMKEGNKTNTFCGTPEYLAPEVLIGQGYTKTVDWWTLGILLYEMLSGLPPFYDENTNVMYKKILQDELRFGDDMSSNAVDLLKKLLNRDGAARLGANGAQEIKSHPFFAEVDWRKLMGRKYAPPFRPNVASATDTSNFDEEFTSEAPTDSLSEGSQLSEAVQQQFQGFTYQATEAIAGSIAAGSMMGAGMGRADVSGSYAPQRQAGGMRNPR